VSSIQVRKASRQKREGTQ